MQQGLQPAEAPQAVLPVGLADSIMHLWQTEAHATQPYWTAGQPMSHIWLLSM